MHCKCIRPSSFPLRLMFQTSGVAAGATEWFAGSALEFGEGRDEVCGERELPVVDSGSDFGSILVGHARHLVLGIEVVDVVQHEGLGAARESG